LAVGGNQEHVVEREALCNKLLSKIHGLSSPSPSSPGCIFSFYTATSPGSTKNRIPSCARPAPPTARRPVPSPPDGQGKIVENQSGKELWIEIRRLMRHRVARPGDLHNQIRSRRIQNASQVADSVERRLDRLHRVPRVSNVPPVLLELPRHLETLLQHDPMEYRCAEQLPGVGCLLVDDVEELAAVARPQGPAL